MNMNARNILWLGAVLCAVTISQPRMAHALTKAPFHEGAEAKVKVHSNQLLSISVPEAIVGAKAGMPNYRVFMYDFHVLVKVPARNAAATNLLVWTDSNRQVTVHLRPVRSVEQAESQVLFFTEKSDEQMPPAPVVGRSTSWPTIASPALRALPVEVATPAVSTAPSTRTAAVSTIPSPSSNDPARYSITAASAFGWSRTVEDGYHTRSPMTLLAVCGDRHLSHGYSIGTCVSQALPRHPVLTDADCRGDRCNSQHLRGIYATSIEAGIGAHMGRKWVFSMSIYAGLLFRMASRGQLLEYGNGQEQPAYKRTVHDWYFDLSPAASAGVGIGHRLQKGWELGARLQGRMNARALSEAAYQTIEAQAYIRAAL